MDEGCAPVTGGNESEDDLEKYCGVDQCDSQEVVDEEDDEDKCFLESHVETESQPPSLADSEHNSDLDDNSDRISDPHNSENIVVSDNTRTEDSTSGDVGTEDTERASSVADSNDGIADLEELPISATSNTAVTSTRQSESDLTGGSVYNNLNNNTDDPINETRGSTSSRLSSDSSEFASSVVTVEVIPIPPELRESVLQSEQLYSVTEGGDDVNNSSDGANNSGDGVNNSGESCIVDSCVQTEAVEMSDQERLEEKLRQFQNDAKESEEDTEKRLTEGTLQQLSETEKQRRRNLIFDEERFEETFLKCLICREVYNDSDKLPKMLHCHHTFCMDCLYQMYRVEGEFRQSLTSVFRNMPLTVKIQCPTCREGIIISEAELRRLPNDHTIMELLCFVNKTGKNDVQYCPKHQMQPLNFFCEPCIMPVCCDCTVLDHKESKGHRVVNVDEAMKKYTPIVEDTLTEIQKERSTLASKKEALENTQDDLNRIQSGIADQIRKVFDSIREVLDERERELHDVAVSEVDRKQTVIEGHLNTIADREADLNTEFNALQLAKDDKDISLIFTGHKSARDLLARKVFIPTNSTAGFSITFQFSSRADTVIKQQVANLGDVIFHS